MTAVIAIISDVGGEIEQVDRQEVADPVGVAGEPRDQVAGPLAAEVFEREPLEVLVGHVPQVGGDPLADPGHHVGPRPAQQPGQN